MDYSIRAINAALLDAALLDAAKRGDLNEAKRLISKEADVNAYDGSEGNSLYWAVKNNHSDIAKVLLDNGADFFAYDSSRERHLLNEYKKVKAEHCKVSLHLAARLGDLKALEDLLKKEANVNAKNDKGQTPLHLTVEVCYVDIQNPDEVNDYWNQNLGDVKKCGYVKIVEALLRNEEINVNAQDNNKKTSLHYAAKNKNKEIVVALIKAGAYINAVDKDGNTPLHLAAQNGHKDIVEFLLSKEAKVDIKNEFKENPLHLAAQNGYKDIVNALIEAKANVNAKAFFNMTPLLLAALKGHKDIVEILLNKEADVNAVANHNGMTSLSIAAKNGHIDIVKILLAVDGIDINAKNKDEKTPLDLAKTEEIKALLKKAAEKTYDSSASTDSEEDQEEESQEISAEEESDIKDDNGHLLYAEPTQNRVSTSEEHPSSFFDNLLNIIMKTFSLIASFLGEFFSWLFGSDEPSTESDQIIAPSNSGGEELTNYQEGDNNII